MRPLFAVLFMIAAMPAIAQEDIPAPVKFGDYEITFARGEDEEIAVSYNGQEIYRNYFVAFEQIAKVEDKDVAILSGGDGGNACSPATLLLTVPDNSPDAKIEIVGEDCGAPQPAVNANEILFVPYLVPGAKELVQSWAPSTGLVTVGELSFVPKAGSTWANFDVTTLDTPYALLANADIYAATQALTGDKFDELVLLLSVSGTPELVDGKYVSAFGCQPHACGVANGFLGLDLEKKAVFASTRYSDQQETLWPADLNTWPEPLQKAYEASKAP